MSTDYLKAAADLLNASDFSKEDKARFDSLLALHGATVGNHAQERVELLIQAEIRAYLSELADDPEFKAAVRQLVDEQLSLKGNESNDESQ